MTRRQFFASCGAAIAGLAVPSLLTAEPLPHTLSDGLATIELNGPWHYTDRIWIDIDFIDNYGVLYLQVIDLETEEVVAQQACTEPGPHQLAFRHCGTRKLAPHLFWDCDGAPCNRKVQIRACFCENLR